MKSFSLVLLFMSIASICFGQNIVSHDFVGFLRTSDGQVISFKLMLNEIKDGTFKGYSVTNYEGKDYTKSVVEGKLDLKERKISFKEISNTETKSTAENSTFCYISASDLTIETSTNKNIIKGKFQGLFPSGQTCATGVVFLVNEEVLEDIVKEKEPEGLEPMSPNVIKKDTTVPDSIFTSNEILQINKWENGLTLEVWDGDLEDNDEIAIYVNDVLKRGKLILKHQRTIINLPANNVKFKLKIVALNEGKSGKTTLNFRLKKASTDKEYVAELKKGESFEIEFRKDKQ